MCAKLKCGGKTLIMDWTDGGNTSNTSNSRRRHVVLQVLSDDYDVRWHEEKKSRNYTRSSDFKMIDRKNLDV